MNPSPPPNEASGDANTDNHCHITSFPLLTIFCVKDLLLLVSLAHKFSWNVYSKEKYTDLTSLVSACVYNQTEILESGSKRKSKSQPAARCWVHLFQLLFTEKHDFVYVKDLVAF